MEITLHGIGVSPGIVIAPALVFLKSRWEVPQYDIDAPERELCRFDRAVDAAREDLVRLIRQTTEGLGKTHADIFYAHLMLLDDVAIHEEVRERIAGDRKNVEYVLDGLTKRYIKAMEAVEDPRFRERTADLVDVTDRVLGHLLHVEKPNLKSLPQPSIVVAHELSPSDTASMDTENTLGLAMDVGSATSHSAILARALEIPAVVGVQHLSSHVAPGATIIIDGTVGAVIVNAEDATIARYRRAQARFEERRATLLSATETGPSRTADGVEILTQTNIELPIEIPHSLKVNAEGIGLYRTEFLFLNRNEVPGEEEQYAAYSEVARALRPMPVTLRTIDIGGDKLVAHLQVLHEDNPQLGWRAVRFCLARPDIFKPQLRAMLRASAHGNVRIMFPMISGVEELRDVKSVLEEVRADLDEASIPYDHDIKVGSMIEVPSAVMIADLLAKECDFFSIGTNDLIQYSLAVDRVNEKIAHLYEPAHPGVLRMISRVTTAAVARGIPCGICGEMAGDPLYTELLLGLGVTSLSMSPIVLPVIRAEIASIRMADARQVAIEALGMSTAREVKDLLRRRSEARGTVDDYLAGIGREV